MSKLIKKLHNRNLGHIVKHENGNYYYIDSANTFDRGYETMVFKCEKEEDNFRVDFRDLYTVWYQDYSEMKRHHMWLIKHLEKVELDE